jgi:hypothetical protein
MREIDRSPIVVRASLQDAILYWVFQGFPLRLQPLATFINPFFGVSRRLPERLRGNGGLFIGMQID